MLLWCYRLAIEQQECASLRQQLEDARLRTAAGEAADSPDKLSAMLLTLRADHDKVGSFVLKFGKKFVCFKKVRLA